MDLYQARNSPDTPIAVDELRSRARALAESAHGGAAPEARVPCLAFAAGGEWFALPLGSVHEVLRGLRVVPIPHTPAAVRGVVNRRGDIVPVVDLAVLVGGQAAGGGDAVVVVGHGALIAGLLVDGWPELVDVAEAGVAPVPHESRFVRGIYHDGDRHIRMLVAEPFIAPDIYRVPAATRAGDRTPR